MNGSLGLEQLRKDVSVHGQNVDKFNPEEILVLRRTLAVMTYLAYRALGGIEGQTVKQNLNGDRQSTTGKVRFKKFIKLHEIIK